METMKELEGLTRFDETIRVYIPSTVDVNRHAPELSKRYRDLFLSLMSKEYGGATEYKARGAWNSDSLGLVTESVTIVESKSDNVRKGIGAILAGIASMKDEMAQESIALEVNGSLFLA